MIEIDVEKVAQIIRDVSATEVMPRFNKLAKGDIREKHPGDFVTIADEASEKALSAALRALLPGSLVVGEEDVAKDLSVLDRLKSDKPVWVIDPIDGTYNYAHGRSKFGILVSLVQNDVTLYGWVFDPIGDRMGIAIKGKGATINGKPAKMRKTAKTPDEMTGMGGGGQAWHFEPVNGQIKEIVNHRSSLHDFLDLAEGKADFALHLSKVTPWDHAATVLLAEEAGAFVLRAGDRLPFRPSMHEPCMLLAAADEARWNMIEKIVHPVLAKRRQQKPPSSDAA